MSLHPQTLMKLDLDTHLVEFIGKKPLNKFMTNHSMTFGIKHGAEKDFSQCGVFLQGVFHEVIVLAVGNYEYHLVFGCQTQKVVIDVLVDNTTAGTLDVHDVLVTAFVPGDFNGETSTGLDGHVITLILKFIHKSHCVFLNQGFSTCDTHTVEALVFLHLLHDVRKAGAVTVCRGLGLVTVGTFNGTPIEADEDGGETCVSAFALYAQKNLVHIEHG